MHTGKLNLTDFILNKKTSAFLKTGSCFSARITVCSVVLGLCLSLILIPQQILADEEQALPKNWEKISLKKLKLQVKVQNHELVTTEPMRVRRGENN